MSRSKHAKKQFPGKEYWSRRAGNRHGGLLGKDQKKFTRRIERKQGKKEARG